MSNYRIVIIGAGNVGYQLAWHLHNAGQSIVQVFSRHLPAAEFIGNLMDIPCTNEVKEITKDADVYLMSVKDDAVAEVASQLSLNDKVIAHTSGSVSKEVLKTVSNNYGIFYPLQTLSRHVSVDFSAIPICLDASNEKTYEILSEVASSLSTKIIKVDEQKRLAIHVAAVFANNFTNHLFALAEIILEQNDLSFEILKPLIQETVRKIQNHVPIHVQTGPAMRNDENTIRKHLEFLQDQEAEIYRMLTESIKNLQHHQSEVN